MSGVASINKVILVGRIGSDVTFRETSGKLAMARFAIATDDINYNNKKVTTTFTRIACFGKKAILLRDYGTKGRLIGIEGMITNRSWMKDGERKWMTEILAEVVTFLTPIPTADEEEKPQEREPGDDDPFA